MLKYSKLKENNKYVLLMSCKLSVTNVLLFLTCK
jgi:hypothetical protein